MTFHAARATAAAVLCLIAAVPARAQDPAPAASASSERTGGRALQYGVRFGLAFTSLTSVETFDSTAVAAADEPTLHYGGFATVRLPGPLAFQPEVLFVARGERAHDKDAQPTISGSGIKPPPADRVILLRYVEIPMLVRAARRRGPDSSIYAIGGPALAIGRSAVNRQVANPGRYTDIGDMVTGSNLSLVYGGGMQHGRWLVDARFTKGLKNVAVTPQPAPVKTSGFAVLIGVRLSD